MLPVGKGCDVTPNRERLQQFALVGLRPRLSELIEELAELRDAFGGIGGLANALAGISAAIQQVDEALERPKNGAAKPAAKPKAKPAAKKPAAKKPAPAKPSPKPDPPPELVDDAHLRSWLTGRDVLAILKSSQGGATVKDIAARLQISQGATYHRMQTRVRKGHARLAEASGSKWLGLYDITPAGIKALELDRDVEI